MPAEAPPHPQPQPGDPAHEQPVSAVRPEWALEEDSGNTGAAAGAAAGAGGAGATRFASWVISGVSQAGVFAENAGGAGGAAARRKNLSVDELAAGIAAGDRGILARAITLVESSAAEHQERAQELLARMLPRAGKSMRVGITGIPGAGKSTAIEALGMFLCGRGHRVAVLAVDPSSSVNGGSILGDRVRMERLARQAGAFIRPSPTGGALGGVTRKSRETMLLCEAAGFDVIIVETVGVGQSEVTVRSMVDCFVLLAIAGAGDEVQGIKRGVMEMADVILVNKADGDNRLRAQTTRAELALALGYLRAATEGWTTPALTMSALTGSGVAEAWGVVENFFKAGAESGALAARRREQAVAWMHALVREALLAEFYATPAVRDRLPAVERAVAAGEKPALAAARGLLGLR